MTKKTFRYEKGVYTPIEKEVKKAEVMPKPLTPLQKYQKACDLYEEQGKIKKQVKELMETYRSNAQKIGEMLRK